MMNCIARRGLVFAALSLGALPTAHAFSFSDGTLFNLLYARTTYQWGFGGTVSTSGTATMGNPGSARFVQLSHNGNGTGVGATHMATQSAMVLQPGGITDVSFSIDLKMLSLSSPVDLAFVVEQGGKRYASYLMPQMGSDLNWETITTGPMIADDFEEIVFDGNIFRDPFSRPDFQLAGIDGAFRVLDQLGGFWLGDPRGVL